MPVAHCDLPPGDGLPRPVSPRVSAVPASLQMPAGCASAQGPRSAAWLVFCGLYEHRSDQDVGQFGHQPNGPPCLHRIVDSMSDGFIRRARLTAADGL